MIGEIKKKYDTIPITVRVSIAYAFCGMVQKSISFITLPLFTRILTTEQYGQCTIYNSWSSILSIFLTLNLAYGSFSTAMIKFEKERAEYIASVEGICLALSAVFLTIYFAFVEYWNRLFELPTIFIVLMVFEVL